MDPLPQCWLDYLECKRLLEVEAKNDPESDPYRSKYKARDILLRDVEIIDKYLAELNPSHSDIKSFKSAKSGILGQIGIIYLETEELTKAEKYFLDTLESISDPLDPDSILVSVQVRNQLGYLWSHRGQPEDAKKWLEEAEKLFVSFRKKPEAVAVAFYQHLGDEPPGGDNELEQAHTLTKFYLAQVYGALKEVLKSAIYCHETLRRELEYGIYSSVEWALNAATLSQVFMERNLLKQARHHLAAASHVLNDYEQQLEKLNEPGEIMEAKREELKHRSADVSRCWSKYGIYILEQSKNCLEGKAEEASKEKFEELEKLWFHSLDLSSYENQIVATEVVTFEDAREVFLVTQIHLNKAKEYYTLEDRASDHVQIVQDHSQLFRHLSAFESDEERQYKMMKKRVDMLEVVLKELNPTFYLDVCRQLWFELGETYHDMMQIKFQKVKDVKDAPAPQDLMKINSLAASSVLNFNRFLDSVKDKKTKELPQELPEDLIGPVLVAHFYLGRLYHKYVTPDKRKQIENTTKAYECFKYLVEKCENNEKAAKAVGEELNISKEMMALLQMKILQL